MNTQPKLKVLDLFSGIGGFSLGLERTGGFETVAFCEMKPHAQAVLAKNFPGVPCHDDVTTYDFKEGEADVITAGFPCQDISYAGAGAGLSGSRSGLYREVIRAVRMVRPKWAVLENVAALLGRGLDVVLGDLAQIGHDAEWHCIPASAVGAPHRRDRIWIVAHPGGEQHEGGSAPLSGALAAELSRAAPDTASMFGAAQFGDEPDRDFAGGREMADAASEWFNRCRTGAEVAGWPEPSDGDWWASEPDVGRVADGVPAELDGGFHAEEKHAAEAGKEDDGEYYRLSGLRRDGASGAASSGLFTARDCRSALPAVSHQGGPAGWDAQGEGNENLRQLRQGVYAHTQQEAHALQSGMPFGRWPHERGEALGQIWSQEPDVGRVAHGVEGRVDRLAELGNAVVPAIPELIGRAILEIRSAA
jgi:DNA (cytosine-5)-methyltransferase 1